MAKINASLGLNVRQQARDYDKKGPALFYEGGLKACIFVKTASYNFISGQNVRLQAL